MADPRTERNAVLGATLVKLGRIGFHSGNRPAGLCTEKLQMHRPGYGEDPGRADGDYAERPAVRHLPDEH